MQAETLIDHLEQKAPLELAADWDQSGIQVSSTKKQIKRLAISLDPDPETLTRALSWKADFILTHHPLSLKPELPCRENTYTRSLRLLFQNDVWLYSAHTSLDVQSTGPVAWLARSMHWSDLKPVRPVEAEGQSQSAAVAATSQGYGLIGRLPVPCTPKEFYRQLGNILGIQSCIRSGPEPELVQYAAYCPGSGMDLAPAAFAQGAQLFISGDLKYHQAQALQDQGLVLDVGHFVLEELMMQTWAQDLSARLKAWQIETAFFPGREALHIHCLQDIEPPAGITRTRPES